MAPNAVYHPQRLVVTGHGNNGQGNILSSGQSNWDLSPAKQ
jgi:hypothetical protein